MRNVFVGLFIGLVFSLGFSFLVGCGVDESSDYGMSQSGLVRPQRPDAGLPSPDAEQPDSSVSLDMMRPDMMQPDMTQPDMRSVVQRPDMMPDMMQPDTRPTSSFKRCWLDPDGDGYAAHGATVIGFRGQTCPEGYTGTFYGVAEDCLEQDPDVFPTQTEWFTKSNLNSSWDYNCDSVVTKRYPDKRNCRMESGECVGDGWKDLVPSCGDDGLFSGCHRDWVHHHWDWVCGWYWHGHCIFGYWNYVPGHWECKSRPSSKTQECH